VPKKFGRLTPGGKVAASLRFQGTIGVLKKGGKKEVGGCTASIRTGISEKGVPAKSAEGCVGKKWPGCKGFEGVEGSGKGTLTASRKKGHVGRGGTSYLGKGGGGSRLSRRKIRSVKTGGGGQWYIGLAQEI